LREAVDEQNVLDIVRAVSMERVRSLDDRPELLIGVL